MPERKNSAARIKANNKYNEKTYDRINIAVPKGRKAEIKAHAEAHSESVNGFIGRAIDETMNRDNGTPSEAAGGAVRHAGAILPPDILENAESGAEATGEALTQFVSRAVSEQRRRDKEFLRMGVNPATNEILKRDTPEGSSEE